MWETNEIKRKGRDAFKLNYWKCVLVSLILGFIMAGTSSISISQPANSEGARNTLEQIANMYNGFTPGQRFALIMTVSSIFTIGITLNLLIRIFLYNPLQVGGLAFYKKNIMNPPAELNEMLAGFCNYVHIFITLFLTDLFLALWYCLLIVPGIIKSYSYRMVPYILVDEPDLSPMDTITRSKKMMNGHKWHAFCYDLSFIGWYILSILTCGLVGIFWLGPYKYSSDAALYLALKNNR